MDLSEGPVENNPLRRQQARAELGEHLSAALVEPSDVGRFAAWVGGAIFVAWAMVALMLHSATSVILVGALVCVGLVALELSSTLATWTLARRKLFHGTRVVELILELCTDVVPELEAMAAGEEEPPSPEELVHAVFEDAIRPVLLEQAQGGWFSWLLAPLFSGLASWAEQRLVRSMGSADVPVSKEAMAAALPAVQQLTYGLDRFRDTVLFGSKRFIRWVLPSMAATALIAASLQALPVVVTTAGLASDMRAASVTGTLQSDSPMRDPITGDAICALGLETSWTDPERTPVKRVKLADGVRLVDGATTLQLEGKGLTHLTTHAWSESGTWTKGALWEDGGTTPLDDPYPAIAPPQLKDDPDATVRFRPQPCGEELTVFGEQSGATWTLSEPPPHPAERVALGFLLLWMTHTFGSLALVPTVLFTLTQLAYTVYVTFRR
ncbi:MAG: hypothetical protein KC912_10670 [Proteobacteria bacterium]|nr:hypothetical protein [Pseudomonadota bacterium]